MKNTKDFIIIGLSIIIGSLIISLTIFNKNYSAKEHCYKRNYNSILNAYKKDNSYLESTVKYTIKQMEAKSARRALIMCRIK